jgi:LPS O-antigen subunit length determinant protein (WzzB/FepE family)
MTESKFGFDSSIVLQYFAKNIKKLLIISIIAAIIAAVISLFIKDKYSATVVMYPASGISVSTAVYDPRFNEANNSFLKFGSDNESEQLMQVLNSYQIYDYLNLKYNLFEHYKINKNSKYPKTELRKKLKSNINISRNEYMAVEIDVIDEDKTLVANLANSIADYADTIINNSKRERAQLALTIITEEEDKLRQLVKANEDSLAVIRHLGVNDYGFETQSLYLAYGNALAKGEPKGIEALEKRIKTLSKYGTAYLSLSELNFHLKTRLNNLNEKLAQAKTDAAFFMSNKFVIDKAEQPEKKVYPKRSIIVLGTFFSTFILSLMLIIVIDKLKSIGLIK